MSGGLVGVARTLAFTLSEISQMESFSQSSDTIRLVFKGLCVETRPGGVVVSGEAGRLFGRLRR